jgi:flagellar FliL protein
MSKAEAKADDAAEAPRKKSKLLPIIVGVVLLLAAGGGAAAWFFLKKGDDEAAAKADAEAHGEHAKANKKADKHAPPVYVPLDPFVVNLADAEESRYLQVGLVLEVEEEAVVAAVKAQMPAIRNRILLLLSSKNAAELASLEGKQKLAQAIVDEARAPLPKKGPTVEGVHFSSFIIQ